MRLGSFIIMTTELCRCARGHQINGDSVITNTMHLIKFFIQAFIYFHFSIFIPIMHSWKFLKSKTLIGIVSLKTHRHKATKSLKIIDA